MRFLDANVILRYLTRDDEAKAEACYELFQRVQREKRRSRPSKPSSPRWSTCSRLLVCRTGWTMGNSSAALADSHATWSQAPAQARLPAGARPLCILRLSRLRGRAGRGPHGATENHRDRQLRPGLRPCGRSASCRAVVATAGRAASVGRSASPVSARATLKALSFRTPPPHGRRRFRLQGDLLRLQQP